MQSRTAILLLEDGTVFKGVSQGSARTSTGEICFNTGMTGYQEIFTDPSYFGQIMVTSTAHMGNYGAQAEEIESDSVKIAGLVCKNFSKNHSRVRESRSLEAYLVEQQIPTISNVDTRKLVRHIREKGTMNAIISTDGKSIDELKELLAKVPSMKGRELASSVSTKEKYEMGSKSSPRRVAIIDLGLKTNTVRNLVQRDTFVAVFPYNVSLEELTAWQPDGIVLSNGPGDPEPLTGVTALTKSLIDTDIPVLGICLGHQIISLSQGLTTYKMHNGHRGINHPVLNTISGKCEITSQNHGFAVSRESCQANPDIEISHVHLNDNTIAGIRIKNKPVVSVQYHPEAGPGPEDSNYLFDEFFQHMEVHQKKNDKRVGNRNENHYESDIARAAAFLNKGEVIAIPTETAYGLAGNAFDKTALKKIIRLKGQSQPNSLLLHIKSVAELDTVAEEIPEAAVKLAKKFWPGLLTLVLKGKSTLPDLVTGGKPTVAVRIPGHPVALELLEAVSFPLAAPAANPLGSPLPLSESQVAEQLKEAIPMILEGGPCEKGLETTVVGFENGRPVLLREGALTKEQIAAVAGDVIVK